MKRLVMMLVAFLLVGTGAMFAQEDTRATRKAAKEAEKAAREAAEMQAFETAKKAIFDIVTNGIEDGRFLVEAIVVEGASSFESKEGCCQLY